MALGRPECRSSQRYVEQMLEEHTEISRIRFIFTDGRISINSSEAMNSNSEGVMDERRLAGRAIVLLSYATG